jgi:hypothetical protein
MMQITFMMSSSRGWPRQGTNRIRYRGRSRPQAAEMDELVDVLRCPECPGLRHEANGTAVGRCAPRSHNVSRRAPEPLGTGSRAADPAPRRLLARRRHINRTETKWRQAHERTDTSHDIPQALGWRQRDHHRQVRPELTLTPSGRSRRRAEHGGLLCRGPLPVDRRQGHGTEPRAGARLGVADPDEWEICVELPNWR